MKHSFTLVRGGKSTHVEVEVDEDRLAEAVEAVISGAVIPKYPYAGAPRIFRVAVPVTVFMQGLPERASAFGLRREVIE